MKEQNIHKIIKMIENMTNEQHDAYLKKRGIDLDKFDFNDYEPLTNNHMRKRINIALAIVLIALLIFGQLIATWHVYFLLLPILCLIFYKKQIIDFIERKLTKKQ